MSLFVLLFAYFFFYCIIMCLYAFLTIVRHTLFLLEIHYIINRYIFSVCLYVTCMQRYFFYSNVVCVSKISNIFEKFVFVRKINGLRIKAPLALKNYFKQPNPNLTFGTTFALVYMYISGLKKFKIFLK